MPVVAKAKASAVTSFKQSQQVVEQYPPLKAFVVALAALSAIPLAIFLAFGATTGAVVLGIAGTGVALVQGSLLAFGGFFLFWFLIGALFFAGIASGM